MFSTPVPLAVVCLFIIIIVLHVAFDFDHFSGSSTTTASRRQPPSFWRRRLQAISNSGNSTSVPKDPYDGPLRILYSLTTLTEYNTGRRSTSRGSDRMRDTLIPVLREGVESMVEAGYAVDVQIICGYEMKPERRQLIVDALPDSVKLFVWDDATPLGYRQEHGDERKEVKYQTRGLARQHRFVVKDKLFEYDFFVNFEDDMLVKASHVQHFLYITNELERLRQDAPEKITRHIDIPFFRVEQDFYGNLTKRQLQRMIPGFVRVESLLDEEKYPAQNNTGPLPIDMMFEEEIVSSSGKEVVERQRHVNSTYCCGVKEKTASSTLPQHPPSNKLFLWEIGQVAFAVRKMPEHSSLGWVLMQKGPSSTGKDLTIGDFYAGRVPNVRFEWGRPPSIHPKHINNQGGWMATRQQIWEWHTEICPGGFLPPFDPPHYQLDGLDLRNVEYWSGGLHLCTIQHACNMQRIVMIDPEAFSKQLLYHTSNNKQRQRTSQREDRFVKVDTMLGQLNTIKKEAQRIKKYQVG